MNVAQTTELEPLAVKSENIIHLPLGLLGFEHLKKYVLLTNEKDAPFRWLQVLTDPTLAFLVISPFEVMPEYQPEITDEDAEFIGLKTPQDALVWNIVTLRNNGHASMNLKGPVILNRFTLIGKQMVIANAAQYALQHPLPVVGTTAS
jgi:flagellar assembly factor FliW